MRWWHSALLVLVFFGTIQLHDASNMSDGHAHFMWGLACVLVFFGGTNLIIYSVVERSMRPIREALEEIKALNDQFNRRLGT